jgi:hypothetical protein
VLCPKESLCISNFARPPLRVGGQVTVEGVTYLVAELRTDRRYEFFDATAIVERLAK